MSSYALMAYSFGLLGFSFVKVLAPGYFARQDTRTPVRISIISLGVNIGLNLAVVAPLVYFKMLPAPHAFLALSTGISACTNSALLFRGLRKRRVLIPGPGWVRLLWRVAIASAAMGAVLAWMAGDMNRWFAMHTWERVSHTLLCCVTGAGVYFVVLYAAGTRAADLRH
jgi:putative peptidoglycan lipid II flippase